MTRCENCLHKNVCLHKSNIQSDTYAYMGVRYGTKKCEHYVSNADVAPKIDVTRGFLNEANKVLTRYLIGTISPRDMYEMLCYLKEKYTEEKT